MTWTNLIAESAPTAADWLAAWGQVGGAVATFCAVIVALWLAGRERGRIKVKLKVGALAGSGRGLVSASPNNVDPDWLKDLAAQGFGRRVVAVEVINVGRQPVTVQKWSLASQRGASISPLGDSIGPGLPYRLEAGDSTTWAVDMSQVAAFVETCKVLPRPQPATVHGLGSAVAGDAWRRGGTGDGLVAVVELADGRSRRSAEMFG